MAPLTASADHTARGAAGHAHLIDRLSQYGHPVTLGAEVPLWSTRETLPCSVQRYWLQRAQLNGRRRRECGRERYDARRHANLPVRNPLAISKVVPSTSSIDGGGTVTVVGNGFHAHGIYECRFGDSTVKARRLDATQLLCEVPSYDVGDGLPVDSRCGSERPFFGEYRICVHGTASHTHDSRQGTREWGALKFWCTAAAFQLD